MDKTTDSNMHKVIDPLYEKTVTTTCWVDDDGLLVGKMRYPDDDNIPEYLFYFRMKKYDYFIDRLKQSWKFLFDNDYYVNICMLDDQAEEWHKALEDFSWQFSIQNRLYSPGSYDKIGELKAKSGVVTEVVKQAHFEDWDLDFIIAIGDPQIVITRDKDRISYDVACRCVLDEELNFFGKLGIAFDNLRGINRYYIHKNEVILNEDEMDHLVNALGRDLKKVKLLKESEIQNGKENATDSGKSEQDKND